jgi:peptide subunit release factor 1 (eRF1)
MAHRLERDVQIEVTERGSTRPQALADLLRRLVALPPPILSLYMSLRWSDEQQRDRVWLTLRDRLRSLDDERPLRFVEERVKQGVDVGWGGAALFLGGGTELSVRSPADLPTLVALDGPALVRPLVAAAHGHERALVALVASDEVRVFELAMGRLTAAASHVGDVPKRHERGGWSQLKMQHHRQWHVDTLHREAATSITRMFDANGPVRVLLGGVHEAVANLEEELPKRVFDCVLRLESLAKDDPAHEVVAAAERAVLDADRGEDRAALARVKTLAASGGRGAFGFVQVLDAFNQGRPMRLFVPEKSDRVLALCGDCGFLSVQIGGPCSVCGGACLRLDAAEALVRAAVSLGARIDLADEVAAELRF